MGWREILKAGTASLPHRKDRKYGNDEAVPTSYLSDFSGISEGVGTPVFAAESPKSTTPELTKPTRVVALGGTVAPQAAPVHQPRHVASCAELTRLVRQFAATEGFTENDTEEALRVALEDPDRALSCYRALVVPDPRSGARRTRVLEMLEANPTARYAAITDLEAILGMVVLTIAIRGQASFDLHVPADKWDGVMFLDLLERYSGTVH